MGRELPDELVLPIEFVTNTIEVAHVDSGRVAQIAELMLEHRSLRFEVIGHALPDENVENVERLGRRRAVAAMSLIGQQGPSRRRFTATSGGVSSDPSPRYVILRVTAR